MFLEEQLKSSLTNKSWLRLVHYTSFSFLLLTVLSWFLVSRNSITPLQEFVPLFTKDVIRLVGIVLIFYLIVFLIFQKKIRPPLGLTILFLLVPLDLFLFSRTLPFHWLVDRAVLERENPTAAILKSTPEPFRNFRILDEINYGETALPAVMERHYRLQSAVP